MGGATAVSDQGPAFYAISADSVTSDAARAAQRRTATVERSAARSMAKAAVAKKMQILQVWEGIQVAGADGVSVATGPKQVVEATGGNIRAYVKSTGAIPVK